MLASAGVCWLACFGMNDLYGVTWTGSRKQYVVSKSRERGTFKVIDKQGSIILEYSVCVVHSNFGNFVIM